MRLKIFYMVIFMAKKVVEILLIVFFFASINGQTINNSINHIPLINQKTDNYSFLIAGHVYGSPELKNSLYPASSLISGIRKINESGAKFMFLLGDNYWKSDSIRVSNFKDSFLKKVKLPVFNAVGNHDLWGDIKYEYHFGKTFYSFNYQNDFFVILNSEMYFEEQIEFLNDELKKNKSNQYLKRLFLFTHKLLFVIDDKKFEKIFNGLNSKEGYDTKSHFSAKIKDFIKNINLPTVWFAGDIGMKNSLPLFYDYDSKLKIEYIATGLGGVQTDNILIASISSSSFKPSYQSLSLTGDTLHPLKEYNMDYWKSFYNENDYRKTNLFNISEYFINSRYYAAFLLFVMGIIFVIIKNKFSLF